MRPQTAKLGTVRHAFAKLREVVGGMAGRASSSTISSGNAFVEKVAISDRYEIEAAKVALRRTKSPEVIQLARTMISDHTASTHHVQAALEMNETRGVRKPPNALDERHSRLIEHLESAPDDRFNATYLDQQLLAHEEALTLLVHYCGYGDNAQLRSCAEAAAPVVYRHLQHAKALRQGH